MDLKGLFKNAQSNDFMLEIGAGNIEGYRTERKFFFSPNLGLNTLNDVWSYSPTQREMQYTADTGADFYLTSSSASDAGKDLSVRFQDEEGNEFIAVYTCQGQTPIKLNDLDNVKSWKSANQRITPFLMTRSYRIANEGNSSFVGQIFITEGNSFTAGVPDDSTKVRAHVPLLQFSTPGDRSSNKTLMAPYRIPKGWYGAIILEITSVLKGTAGAVDFSFWARRQGGVFAVEDTFDRNSTGTTEGVHPLIIPELYPPLTDITMKAIATSNNMGASGLITMILIREEFVNKAGDGFVVRY
jgi:hypothetical protein